MNVVILQPSYIPWRGYFEQIHRADLFIFYDDVKYDKNGWRNRNRVKTPGGAKWLTIPVGTSGLERNQTPINAIHVLWDKPWTTSHWNTLRSSYGEAPYFKQYAPVIEEFYCRRPDLLAEFTISTTITIARLLGIQHTQFMRSSEMSGLQGTKTRRLIEILARVGATHYISGPSARDYVEEDLFHEAGITLEYMDYRYREYPQLYPPYDPQVSILDLLFMTGPAALDYIIREEKHG